MKRLVTLAAFLFATPAWAGGYTEHVVFSFDQDQISYNGALTTAYLLLDDIEGMNPLCEAIPMTPSGGGTWSVGVDLEEGDYIYVFVANADAYVDLSDCGLNPDDVPDSNFFNDPSPMFAGLAGQFGKDNVYYVRSPDRPKFVATSVAPLPGTLITTGGVSFTIQAQRGASGTPLDPTSVRVRFEESEPAGLWRPSGPIGTPVVVDVPASFSWSDATQRGTIAATIADPPEGFHRIFVDVAGTDGLTADTFTTSVMVNRVNQTPTADAGPTRFARVGGAVQLLGTGSRDADRIGLNTFAWRIVSGPGGGNFVSVDEEKVFRDGFGEPIMDDDGLQTGQLAPTQRANVRFEPQAAGTYVVGLTVTDSSGAVSAEDTTRVYVVPAFDTGSRARLTVSQHGAEVWIDARTSSGGGTARFIPDDNNPAPLTLTPSTDPRLVTFPTPEPGTYYVHVQIGDSHPATAIVRVSPGGQVTGGDFAVPPRWWRDEAVIYLVFPREFQDSDGDGRGDFAGLTSKLPYIRDLGVNAIWLMPVTPGPTSHGYAATAHFLLEEDYGAMADFDAFTQAAHDLGIQVIKDVVANHTSNRHPFFEAAVGNPASPFRDYYVFNTATTYDYAFDFATLPSVNYNNPLVHELFLDYIDFWMDHGVDSIRCDIAGFVPPSFWRETRRLVRGRSDDAMLLAELIPPHSGFFDGEQFDMAYDAYLFWNFKDLFATTGGLDGFDAALDSAERFIQDSPVRLVRERQDPANVIRMRYIDNQDEDRFLLKAGRSLDRLRAAAGAVLNLPGTPMIYYGDETGAVQQRGPMKVDANPDILRFYRRLLDARQHNAGLRGQDYGAIGEVGDSYTRINSDSDTGGYSVFSFARWREGQRFVVLVNRFDASVLGTQVRYWPPPAALADFDPDATIYLQNLLDPTDILAADVGSLSGGFTSSIGRYETKVYQLLEHPILDTDGDGVLDSWDNCINADNELQGDADVDGVGDVCDTCPGTTVGAAVGTGGCAAPSGAPRRRFDVFDGVVDDDAYEVAPGLWASWNGQELYVATTAATPGVDRFVLLSTDTGTPVDAPFGKSGSVAGAKRVLADEGDNDHAAWLGVTAQARGSAAIVALAEDPPAAGAVVEGTLNLQEQFGDTLPERIWLAAVEYDGGDGGALIAQSPTSTDSDGDVDADEMLEFPLPDPTPPDPPGPGDFDGDGVTDDEDNCIGIANADQADFDADGVGDLCDLCPASLPGPVDGQGCGVPVDPADPPRPDEGQSLGCGCRAGGAGAPGPAGAALVVVLLLISRKAWRRRS